MSAGSGDTGEFDHGGSYSVHLGRSREGEPIKTVSTSYEMDISVLPQRVQSVLTELIEIPTEGRKFEEITADIDRLGNGIKAMKPAKIDKLVEDLERVVNADENFPSSTLASKIGFLVAGLVRR